MFGVLGRRRGPGDYLLFPNEMREDEGNRSEGFGAFFFFLGFHFAAWTAAH